MKNDKVGSFAWFTKMNEANDEQKETKFFNSKDRYKISLKCEREKTDKRSSAPSRRYEVNEKGLTLAQVVSILKKNDKPGTMKTPGISVNSYTITNETTGKTYTHSERSGKGLYDKGLSNITVSDLKAINESDEFEDENEMEQEIENDTEDRESKPEGEVTLDTINDILKDLAEEYPEGGPGEINVINFTQNNITLTVPFEDGFYGETMKYGEGDDLKEIVPKLIKKIKKKIKDMDDAESEE